MKRALKYCARPRPMLLTLIPLKLLWRKMFKRRNLLYPLHNILAIEITCKSEIELFYCFAKDRETRKRSAGILWYTYWVFLTYYISKHITILLWLGLIVHNVASLLSLLHIFSCPSVPKKTLINRFDKEILELHKIFSNFLVARPHPWVF